MVITQVQNVTKDYCNGFERAATAAQVVVCKTTDQKDLGSNLTESLSFFLFLFIFPRRLYQISSY